MNQSPSSRGSEGKILIVVLAICVIAAIGFRYQLTADRPTGDQQYYRQPVNPDDLPGMEGNNPVAPPA